LRPWLLVVATAWLAAPVAPAQQENAGNGALPPWVVPVLRLVSATHVEPTTGVVLSAEGLVLVPHEFAAAGDEIVVLDGGTDIIRNGRPARLERAFPELGLKVLAVDGLRRRAAPVAVAPAGDGDTLSLAAFPPAEDIAEGAPPLRRPATVTVPAESGLPVIATESNLPNVTGPLLDGCGNLAGFSIAGGVQTLSPSPATQYRWQATLLTVLAELGLPATGSNCVAEPAPPEEVEPPAEAPAEASPPEDPVESLPEPDEQEPPPEPPPEVADEVVEEVVGQSAETSDKAADVAPPAETGGWLWPRLAAALIGLLLVAGGVGAWRWRTRAGSRSGPSTAVEPGAAGSAAGQTVAAERGSDEPAGETAGHRLVLRGEYADGRALLVSAAVSDRAVNLEIGRGSADLVIDSPAISRRHARLNGTAQALTLSDLGSSNGTSINGVPCMEGEIMYLAAGDEVILGDVRFTVELEPAERRQRAE
jgi:hypothetical protein